MKRGFTLLELLVAMAIVGILAALAWPGYGAILRRAQRNEARLALIGIQHAQEMHYQRFHAYTDALTTPPAEGGLGAPARSVNGSYQLAVSTRNDAQGFTASAHSEPGGRQEADSRCAEFHIDETGLRLARDADGRDTTAECWR